MYRLDEKILTVDEFMSLAEKTDGEMTKSANQLYIRKYGLEFENEIGVLLAQIYKNNGEDRTFGYTDIYNLLEKLAKSTVRGLRDEIYNAIIPHLQQMKCIDNRHFKALLHLYDVVDFKLETIKDFDILDFLMAVLIQKDLEVKLRHPIGQEESEVVYDFLSNTTHPTLISPALSSFKEAIENGDKAIIDDLLIDLSVLSDIQLKYLQTVVTQYFANNKSEIWS